MISPFIIHRRVAMCTVTVPTTEQHGEEGRHEEGR